MKHGDRETDLAHEQDRLISRGRYRRMLVTAVLSVSVVAIVPLLVMSTITYHQSQEAFREDLTRPMVRFAQAGKQALESFLSERVAALAMVVRENPYGELQDAGNLDALLGTLKESFGGIVDLGVIDDEGVQIAYAGPYAQLVGRSYAGHDWFKEVTARGVYVSDVFMGYRNRPHIVIAIQEELDGQAFVLRATIDTDVFHFLVRSRASRRPEQTTTCRRCHAVGIQPFTDVFIINEAGVLQTPSQHYGDVLGQTPLPSLSRSDEVELVDLDDANGMPLIVSYARIEGSPFSLVLLSPRVRLHAGWRPVRRDLLLFPALSVVLILAVIVGGSIYMVNRTREADLKRATLYHKMEYTNKMAAIGRLGAGVAHEINNPLAIITEKAGLLRDLLTGSQEMPPRAKLVDLADSVLRSADRCGGITHRLLGFAKQLDVGRETINLDLLLREVLGFLEKEASYRNIQVIFNYAEEPPHIVSDRGQLQQVFLNIINNAFAAVDDGGCIEIRIASVGEDEVAVSIADDGVGIPEDHLEQIFDPFFTTKRGAGTGLGLSITYGIVEKLGGRIDVTSKVAEGTCFTVTLPRGAAPE